MGDTFNSFVIHRSPVQRRHLAWFNPCDLLMLSQSRLARDEMAQERRELHHAEIIGVAARAHRRINIDFAQQLLFDFALQCLTRSFARFDFASGELPISSQRFAVPTLTAQNRAIPNNRRTHHSNEFGRLNI